MFALRPHRPVAGCVAAKNAHRLGIRAWLCVLTAVSAGGLSGQTQLVLDPSLKPEVLAASGAYIYDILALPDGGFLVGGEFIRMEGGEVSYLARLQADGSLDHTRPVATPDGGVRSIVRAPDGGIYVAGYFTEIEGVARPGVARLKADGSLDESFNPGPLGLGLITRNAKLLFHPGGHLLLLAECAVEGDSPHLAMVGLNPDGRVATGWPEVDLGKQQVIDATLSPEGKIYLVTRPSGSFSGLYKSLIRFESDGTPDPSFEVEDPLLRVQAVLVEPDGSLTVGTYPYDSSKGCMVRLTATGAPHPTFAFDFPPFDQISVVGLAKTADGAYLARLAEPANRPVRPLARFTSEGKWDVSLDQVAQSFGTSNRILVLEGGDFFVLGGYHLGADGNFSHVSRLSAAGAIRSEFAVRAFGVGRVDFVVTPPDGSIVIGGSFSRVGGLPRSNLARIKPDGTIDTDYPQTNGRIEGLAVTADGGIIAAGSFEGVVGSAVPGVVRIRADGTVDSSFLEGVDVRRSGFRQVAALPDGSVLLGGSIEIYVDSIGYGRLIRVLANGRVDTQFKLFLGGTNFGPNGTVTAFATDLSGRIILYGDFTEIQETSRPGIARTLADGTLDESFNPEIDLSYLRDLWVLPDNSIVFFGRLTGSSSAEYPKAFRLRADGALDPDFNLEPPEGRYLGAYTVAPDGAYVTVTRSQAVSAHFILFRRYLPDGTPDPSFLAGVDADYFVHSLRFDASGRLLLVGAFRTIAGKPRLGFARFAEPQLFAEISGERSRVVGSGGSATLSVEVEGNAGEPTFVWKRNGQVIPGVESASFILSDFDASKVGNYTVVVSADGVSVTTLPVELVLPVPPAIVLQPVSRNESSGGSVVLAVTVTGRPEPTFQWFKDDLPLQGQTRHELRLRDLNSDDAGSYHVEVTNLGGNVVSTRATITVTPLGVDPLFAPIVGSIDELYRIRLLEDASDRILLTGQFSMLGSLAPNNIARLKANGLPDPGFVPFAAGHNAAFGLPLGVMADGTIYVLRDEAQPVTGYNWSFIRRVTPNGSDDPSFGTKIDYGHYSTILPTTDGKLILSGSFRSLNDEPHSRLARLLPDGLIDATYQPVFDESHLLLDVDPDGRVLVAVNNGLTIDVLRLTADGSMDAGFASPVLNHGLLGALRLADGSFFLYGDFDHVNSVGRLNFARILADGTLADELLGFETPQKIEKVRLLADGSIRMVTQPTPGEYNLIRIPLDGTNPTTVPFSITTWAPDEIGVGIQSDGTVYLAGRVYAVNGTEVDGLARFGPDGAFDATYAVTIGRPGWVHQIQPMPRGRVALAGRFGIVGGFRHKSVAVVGADGKTDRGFNAQTRRGDFVQKLLVLPDESLLLSGYFSPIDVEGPPVQKVIRLLPDGSRDPDFEGRFEGSVAALALLPDGGILVGGKDRDDLRDGSERITRLYPDRSVDTGFDLQGRVVQMKGLPDGRLLVIGNVTDAGGATREGLVRLLADGRIDLGFTSANPSSGSIGSFDLSPDGRIVVSGGFNSLGGLTRRGLGRLNPDGTIDPTFAPPSAGLPERHTIAEMVVEKDGKVVLAGRYIALGLTWQPDTVIARLNVDGSLDPSLNMFVSSGDQTGIYALAVRDNGDILTAGHFVGLGETARQAVGRFTTNRFQAFSERSRVAIPVGGTGYVRIGVVGAAEPAYLWLKNDEPVADADRPILALRDFKQENAGLYRAEITDRGALVRTEMVEVVVSTETVAEALAPLAFSESGGVGSIRVSAPSGQAWTVSGLPDWAEVRTTETAGSQTVDFTLEPNLSGSRRTAAIEVAGRSFEVVQGVSSARLGNISTRARVGAGGQVLIVGFVTEGSKPLNILSRGIGPTLGTFGVKGILPDPVLRLFAGSTEIRGNANWEAAVDRELIVSESQRVGAFALSNGQPDAALLESIAPGAYTAKLSDSSGRSGVALVEFYDRTFADVAGWEDRVKNISTRGQVGRNDEVLIAGIVVSGPVAKQVLVRGVGPGLSEFGVKDFLVDPYLRVVQAGETVALNNDWGYSEEAGLIALASLQAGAFPLDLESRDAALVVTLNPGAYTVVLSGADNGTGVALIEVYDLE